MGVALTFERTETGGTESARVLHEFVEWARAATDDQNRPRIEDPSLRETISRIAIRNEVARLMALKATWVAAAGDLPGVEGSMARLFYATRFQESCSEILDQMGPRGALQHGADGAPVGGRLERAFRHSAVTTIYGGTSEIQRTIIARRGLELPSGR